jgi:hypothetical protein
MPRGRCPSKLCLVLGPVVKLDERFGTCDDCQKRFEGSGTFDKNGDAVVGAGGSEDKKKNYVYEWELEKAATVLSDCVQSSIEKSISGQAEKKRNFHQNVGASEDYTANKAPSKSKTQSSPYKTKPLRQARGPIHRVSFAASTHVEAISPTGRLIHKRI